MSSGFSAPRARSRAQIGIVIFHSENGLRAHCTHWSHIVSIAARLMHSFVCSMHSSYGRVPPLVKPPKKDLKLVSKIGLSGGE